MKNDNLSCIRVPFLTSAVLMLVSILVQIFLDEYEVQGLYKRLLLGISEISLSITIVIVAAAFVFDIVKRTSIIKKIFIVLIFPIAAVFIFKFGFIYAYNAASDLITRNTEDVIIKNINVEKKNAGKAGYLYTITGYDINDKKTSFDISSATYASIKENAKKNIKIIYYEKSRVINDMYCVD